MNGIPRRATTASAVLLSFLLAACSNNDQTGQVIDTATGTVGTQVSADDLDDRVEDALDADSSLRQFRLDVDDDDNTLVLEGAVRTEEQKTLAQQIATTTASGLTIDNRITVSPDAPMREARGLDDIEDRVEDALEADSVLTRFDLDVDDANNRLTIDGRVGSEDQKTRAEDVAKRTAPGVTIVNRVRVQP
ncbi:MAG TPA: BON domain-containing protein [Gemmatimonadaceae bacterium]|jgi:osmotically-inducible protein OsmY|nr:BON domain-containing protein [Gemmatimonadaceae bacterium]